MINTFKVGDKIKFAEEKQRYTVQACNERWAICTKPLNCRKTFLYTIVDFVNELRGPDNYYCKFNYSNISELETALKQLDTPISEDSFLRAPGTNYELEISGRHRIKLLID